MTEKTAKQTEPFTAMGIAAYALVTGLMTEMVESGQLALPHLALANAQAWLDQPGFQPASKMKEARELISVFEQKLELLERPAEGQTQ